MHMAANSQVRPDEAQGLAELSASCERSIRFLVAVRMWWRVRDHDIRVK
jgi:hypothetical protein